MQNTPSKCYKYLMDSKTKKSKTKKKPDKNEKAENNNFHVDAKIIQRMAALSMTGLFPGHEAGAKLPDDFDSKYELIYSAANQTIIKFKDTEGDFSSPIEMRVTVKHDPDIERNEIGYNFRTSKFTLYTKLTDAELDKITFDSSLKQEISKANQLGNELSKVIPSAQLKYFATQAEIMSHGREKDYKENYLPKQFLPKTKKNPLGRKK